MILAAAYAEAGDFERAVEWQSNALELVPAQDQANYRQRLELYRSRKPYHAELR
jgi:hypothetical protein